MRWEMQSGAGRGSPRHPANRPTGSRCEAGRAERRQPPAAPSLPAATRDWQTGRQRQCKDIFAGGYDNRGSAPVPPRFGALGPPAGVGVCVVGKALFGGRERISRRRPETPGRAVWPRRWRLSLRLRTCPVLHGGADILPDASIVCPIFFHPMLAAPMR
jgi:hypothetical protein